MLWTKDENPELVGNTFRIKNIRQVWFGKCFVALYDENRRPIDVVPASLVQKLQSDIEWSVPMSSEACSRIVTLHMQPDLSMSFNENLRKCQVCGPCEKVQKCSKCKIVLYCSKECQKLDWKTHKTYCLSADSK